VHSQHLDESERITLLDRQAGPEAIAGK